ncbi:MULTISPECIES: CehA/McbA family metallohydrolase [Bacillus]|uniref:Polymerase/histidinol phosphatase N-terminal domain-containing protein n=2 Tax=Bacillus TaxID=1386 RepID=A0A0M5JA26_9BACI|nr:MULTISPECIES: CehA/McbA family metallohydrolase [Bacillus]ALC81894.1 hypothetical protein AM592_09950 [Bacillus gobiensis]MBP1083206.1 hypothetical protein [Bacillus capparidis]MED1097646.1 CehA/McbA family metallohydrolase [Bacillus capparidis]
MEQLLTLTRLITKSEERNYIEIPFAIENDLSRLMVKYEVISQGSDPCVVDLGVRDQSRVRGWSGGARSEFYIGIDQATPGYTPGDLKAGEWAILLGAYRIAKEGCIVKLTIISEEKPLLQKSWLKGDLHLHTIHSDGSYLVRENVQIAAQHGLDIIGAMDHNVTSQNAEYESFGDILSIPGMELTTYEGHCNLFGVKEPVLDFRAQTTNEMKSKLQEAKEKGALISINHPFDDGCPWNYGFDLEFDAVEVWNGPWRECNEKAVQWWHEQLVRGMRIPAVGGSDTHRPDPYVRQGYPTTRIYAEKSVAGILSAIQAGNVTLSYSPDGPAIELRADQAIAGDLCKPEQEVSVSISGLEKGDEIKIISNREIEYTLVVESGQSTFHYLWQHVKERFFYRIEVWRTFPAFGKKGMAALSNPIYFPRETI